VRCHSGSTRDRWHSRHRDHIVCRRAARRIGKERRSADRPPFAHILVDDASNESSRASGPQSPFANIPVVIEGAVDWISEAITHVREGGYGTIEPTVEAVDGWRGHVNDLVNATVLRNGRNSWLLGDNIPGKPHEVLFFFGGAGLYRRECREVIEQGFTGFTFGRAAEPALT
jgi:hypothetical protein